MVAFIDEHRTEYGVEPIREVLPIAPSTYYAHRARARDPAKRRAREERDEALRPEIQRVWNENHAVYGVRKVWRQLAREKVRAARCTVDRLMHDLGLRGAVRGRAFQVTTVADNASARPPDLVARQFTATRPNQLWVADITYVATWLTASEPLCYHHVASATPEAARPRPAEDTMHARLRSMAVIVAPLLLASSTAARAATILVNSTLDDLDQGPNGNCTLREAVLLRQR